MQWFQTIYQLIDMRSFSNLWFWIALAVFWSLCINRALGVPFGMVMRVRRHPDDPRAVEDLFDITRINVSRLLRFSRGMGAWLVAFMAFFLSLLAALALWARLELAQALLCLYLPGAVVLVLSLRTALRLEKAELDAIRLSEALIRLRMAVQLIAMISIFLTALVGMYRNLTLSVLH